MKSTPAQFVCITAFLILTLTKVYAQNDKGYIGLHYGSSYPVNNFALKNMTSPNSGFALNGYQLNLDGNFLFNKYIGLSTSILYGRNKFDMTPGINSFHSQVPDAGVYANEDTWKYFGMMAGLYLVIPVHPKINIESRITAGSLTASLPQLDYYITKNGTTVNVEMESRSKTALGYNYSIGLRAHFEKVSFILMLNNLYSQVEFKDVFTFYYVNGKVDHGFSSQIKQDIETVNITLGIGLSLGNLYR